MPFFRKKPVVIEAWQWNESKSLLDEMSERGLKNTSHTEHDSTPHLRHNLRIGTLEGIMSVSPGDWIIRGVNGEFYPCKPDIFAKTYEAIEDHKGE